MSALTTPRTAPNQEQNNAQDKEDQAKKDAAAKKAAETRKAKAGEVVHTVQTLAGNPLHLCADNKWRTDEDLRSLNED